MVSFQSTPLKAALIPMTLVIVGLLSGCNAQELAFLSSTPLTPARTPSPIPPTKTGTPTPTPSPSPTPSPTPTPLHPLSIEWLRQQEYPANEIAIEEVLDPGSNYQRFIASYQSEGLKIYALLTLPHGVPPDSGWPVVVFNHGYIPPDQYRTTARYVAYVDAFARNGYLVFRPDYRGHAESEGIARGGYGNPDYVVDVLNAVASLKTYEETDPGRIGMWGHSMGGYITLRAMLADPDIKAGVIWAGVVASYPDLFARWNQRAGSNATPHSGEWRDGMIDIYGSSEENPDFWDSISANSYVAELSSPLQLHHGTADESVPLEFSETLYKQILEVGGEVEFYTYLDADHNISKFFSVAMQRSIDFFDQHLR